MKTDQTKKKNKRQKIQVSDLIKIVPGLGLNRRRVTFLDVLGYLAPELVDTKIVMIT